MGFQPYRIPSSSFFFNKAVQLLSCVRLFATPWTAVLQAFLSFTISRSLIKLVYWVSDAIQPFHPLLSPSPPVFNLSQHWDLFQWFGSSNQVAQILELQLQHQFFSWTSRADFLCDWLVWPPCVQGALKNLLQHRSWKASVLCCSVSLTVQLSHLLMTSGKTTALTVRTFVSKVMSLLLIPAWVCPCFSFRSKDKRLLIYLYTLVNFWSLYSVILTPFCIFVSI